MDGNDPFGGEHAVVRTKVKIECYTHEKEEGGFRFFRAWQTFHND